MNMFLYIKLFRVGNRATFSYNGCDCNLVVLKKIAKTSKNFYFWVQLMQRKGSALGMPKKKNKLFLEK